MAARRNRDRDSGINKPGDETVDDPDRLDTIEEDSDDSPIHEDSPLHTLPEDIPEEIPIPMAVAPGPAGGVLPGQLSTLPLFDGERGEAFVNWLEVIENAEATYAWTDVNVLSVVRSRGPKIAEWIRAKHFMGHEFTGWRDGNRPMWTPLYEQFGPKYTSSTAVLAVTNLKQRTTETCADFMDRCVLAVDKTYYAVPAAVKNRDGFPAVFAASILSHFGAGLKPEIAKVVLSAAAPPNTPQRC